MTRAQDTRLGALMVTGAAASWGTWSLFLRPSGLPGSFSTPLIFLLMGLFALPIALRSPAAPFGRRAHRLLWANALADALNVLTFFSAMEHTTVAIAVLTHYAAPVLVAVAAPWIDRERNPAALAAAALALAGLTLVLEPWRGGGALGLGAALGLISAVCYAANVFIVRRLAAEIGVARAISYHSLLAAVLLAPLVALGPLGAPSLAGLALITTAAFTIGATSGMIYVAGLARIGSARAGVLTFAEPLVAVAVGILVWNEPASPTMLVGGALVIGAGVWVVRGANARMSREPPRAAQA